jgi:hypothetical protein
MKARTVLCECCGAALDVHVAATLVRCEYCGTLAVIERLVAATDTTRQRGAFDDLSPANARQAAPTAWPPQRLNEPNDSQRWRPVVVLVAAMAGVACTLGLSPTQAMAAALILAMMGVLLGGMLLCVSAHLRGVQSADRVGEDRPLEARRRAAFVSGDEADGLPTTPCQENGPVASAVAE